MEKVIRCYEVFSSVGMRLCPDEAQAKIIR